MNSTLNTNNLIGKLSTNGNMIGKMAAGASSGIKEIYVNDVEQEVDGRRADITINYEMLPDKPSINGIELTSDKSSDDLNLQEKGNYANSRITNSELEEIFRDW